MAMCLWIFALVAVVEESPDLKNEVKAEIIQEERKIGLRAKMFINKEKHWLRDRLGTDDETQVQTGPSPNEPESHPWELTQLEDIALRVGPNDLPIHVVFSTDCTPYQHWQSYSFFLAALRVRQPGRVTQIASGCNEKEAEALRSWFEEQVAPLSLRFGLHLTPHFSAVKDENGKATGEEYEFFNKPHGLKHWLEEGEGMGIDSSTGLPWRHDTIVALLDPDQVLLRPITGHFQSPNDVFRSGDLKEGSGYNRDSAKTMSGETYFTVRHGHPASQEYGFHDGWRAYASVAGPGSNASKVTPLEALRSYAVGPPYLATALDMYKIAVKWVEFVPKVYKLFPQLMAEMYAFSIASADLKLPHQILSSMMVSDTSQGSSGTDGDGEGWTAIDKIPGNEVCTFALNNLDADTRPLPNVLHFCHRYGVGDRDFFAKKKLPTDFFRCEGPLLGEPKMDIGSGTYRYRKPPFLDSRVQFSPVVEKREAFAICAMIGFLNEAALFYKFKHCDEDTMNLSKELYLHDLPE